MHGYFNALAYFEKGELDKAAEEVTKAASFYSMFETEPCGRHSVSVCTNISCMLRGAEDIVAHIEGKLGIKLGESTPDFGIARYFRDAYRLCRPRVPRAASLPQGRNMIDIDT